MTTQAAQQNLGLLERTDVRELHHGRVRVADLPATPFEPDPAMLASVEKSGVLFPVVLTATGEGIVDGNRRIAAAKVKRPADELVHVIYAPAGMTQRAVLALVANWHRKRNVATEAEAVARLVTEGTSLKEIAAEFHVTVPQVTNLYKLTRLPAPLWAALRSGQLAPSVASEIAGLPTVIQELVSELYVETGKLTTKQVRSFRSAVKVREVEQLPDDLFEGPTLGASAPGDMRREGTIEVALTQSNAFHLRRALGDLFSRLDFDHEEETALRDLFNQLGGPVAIEQVA